MNCALGFADMINAGIVTENLTCRAVGSIIFLLCLIIAACMDYVCQEVYNLLWLPSLLIWPFCCTERVMVLGASEGMKGLIQLLMFLILQQLFFSRFYGRADCHAFCCCAAHLWLWNRGIHSYLLHMLCALGILAVIQGIKGNIANSGNLKTPVAFIPYIAISYFTILLFIK